MSKHKETEGGRPETGQAKKGNTKLIVAAVLTVVGLYAVLVLVAIYHPGIHERVKFGTENGLTLAIVIAVIAQVVIYARQWDVMERQLAQTRDHLVQVERPFVYLHGIHWRWRPDLGRPGKYWFTIHPQLANSGSIPTQDMTLDVEYWLADKPLPEGFEFPLTKCGSTLIPPNGKIDTATGWITDDDLAAIQAGTKHYYFWGEIKYRDGFKKTPVHTTHFCQYIS